MRKDISEHLEPISNGFYTSIKSVLGGYLVQRVSYAALEVFDDSFSNVAYNMSAIVLAGVYVASLTSIARGLGIFGSNVLCLYGYWKLGSEEIKKRGG